MQGKCIWCGVVGRPFSVIIPKKCDECADWDVFEAMLDAGWYVNEKHTKVAYRMHMYHWYEALGSDGIPLGYPKAHNRWYAPYGGRFASVYEDLTPPTKTVTVSRSTTKRLAIQRPATRSVSARRIRPVVNLTRKG